MAERKYISEQLNKRTYLKGKFIGKFTGQLDKEKSSITHERFFDIQIVEGHIYTTQNNIRKWPSEEFPEFTQASTFPTKMPGEIKITLGYTDYSEKYFKIKVRELKLVNCILKNQVHHGEEVLGTIEGDVSGYILHQDTILHEIIEDDSSPGPEPVSASEEISRTRVSPKGTEQKRDKASAQTVSQFYNPQQKSSYLSILSFLFWLSLIIGSFVIFKHWSLILLFMVLGCLTVASIYKRFSRFFNFRFKSRFMTVLYTCLFFAALTLLIGFYKSDNTRNTGQQSVAQKRLKQETESLNTSKQNKDSFNYYFASAKLFGQNQNVNEALTGFNKASLFASPEEKKEIDIEKNRIYELHAEKSVKAKKYKEAIDAYTILLKDNKTNPDYLYKRAMCYVKSGNIKEAVADLKHAVDIGDKPALLLYNKINPIKKRIAYYVTRCCDGTTSNAKGQGACSHHGGVCDWNEPVYEEYRKY